MTDLATAATRAADWLAANPTKHIARSLALDARGNKTSPTSDTADCFCAVGRLARELGLPAAPDGIVYACLHDLGIDYDAIYEVNDHGSVSPIMNGGNRMILSVYRDEAIAALRRLAA